MKNYLKKCVARILLLFIIAGSFVCQCNAQEAKTANVSSQDVYAGLGKASDPVPFMQKVRKGSLPNGLKYYILKNNQPENRAFLGLAVNAGSVLEKDDEQGLAHFVEHMAFKGTKRFPKDELLSYLRLTGMQFGPDINAVTKFDETVYHFEVPIEIGKDKVKRIPSKALNILDDWTHAVTFNQKDIDDEKRVILEEERTRYTNSAGRLSIHKLLPTLLKDSVYANRLPIGKQEVIKTATSLKLKDFYDRWYRTDNMALVFVGDFDDFALEKSLVAHFHAPVPKTPLQRPVYDLPLPVKGHLGVEIFTDPEQPYIATSLCFKRQPKPIACDLATRRENFIDGLIGHMLSRRLDKESSKPSAPYVKASAYHMNLVSSSRLYVCGFQAKVGKVEEAIESILQEKERILRYGWTDFEIEQAKLSLMSSFEKDVAEKRHGSFRYLGDFLMHFLGKTNGVADYEWNLLAAKKMFPLITAKDLAQAAKDYFVEDDLAIFVFASNKDKLPSEAKICKIVENVKKSKISPPVSETVDTKLLDKDPAPGSILKETIDPDTKAVILDLSNGSKVILKETANKSDEVVLYALAKGGGEMTATGKDFVYARLASDMFAVSGVGPYSRQELLKKLSGKQVGLGFNIATFSRSLSGHSSVKDIKTLFELIYLSSTHQKFDSDEVNALIERLKTDLVNQDLDPDIVFSKEITKTVYGNNPHFNPLETPDISKINQESALKFVKERLNPADFIFVFVGNIDVEAFRSYIKTYIASIPPLKPIDNLKNDSFERPKSAKRDVFKGIDEKSRVHMSWFTDEKYSQKMDAASKILSEYIDMIILKHIRVKLGGAYSPSGGVDLDFFLNELSVDIGLLCEPKRSQELISAVFKDIENIAEGNIDADVFAKAKKSAQKTWETSIEHNDSIAESYANSVVLYNTPLNRIDKFPSFLEAISKQDLKDIAARLLKGKYYQIILHPEKHKAMR
jgi:zinc protease